MITLATSVDLLTTEQAEGYLEDIRVILDSTFQRRLFSYLIDVYSSKLLVPLLGISRGMIYHYRNGRVDNISLKLFREACTLADIDFFDVTPFIKSTYSFQESVLKIMEDGANIRHKSIVATKDAVPDLNEIVCNGVLDVEKWLDWYKDLLFMGSRSNGSIELTNQTMVLRYRNYARTEMKSCQVVLPRRIVIDKDFSYFFGLWMGDRAGRPRFGIVNKERSINKTTENFLKFYFQNPISTLYITKGMDPPDILVDEIVWLNHEIQGWAIAVHSVNGVFFKFFSYLKHRIRETMDFLDMGAFFAGLFDAEGNVFLEDRCVRWSCKNSKEREIYIEWLKKLNLFDRYDGHGNMVSYNIDIFRKTVLSHMHHEPKLNQLRLMIDGEGVLELRFDKIFTFVNENPGLCQKEIAKCLKRARVYAQLKVLERIGLIEKTGYPGRYYARQ